MEMILQGLYGVDDVLVAGCTLDEHQNCLAEILQRLDGFPWKVVTDNGSFTSEEFRTFMSENGITHITTAPYHPSNNDIAERAVQTVLKQQRETPYKSDSS